MHHRSEWVHPSFRIDPPEASDRYRRGGPQDTSGEATSNAFFSSFAPGCICWKVGWWWSKCSCLLPPSHSLRSHPLLIYPQCSRSGVLRPRPGATVAHRYRARLKRPHTKLSWLPHPGRPPAHVACCSPLGTPLAGGWQWLLIDRVTILTVVSVPITRGDTTVARQCPGRPQRTRGPVCCATVSVGGLTDPPRVNPPLNWIPIVRALSSPADRPSPGQRPNPQFLTVSTAL